MMEIIREDSISFKLSNTNEFQTLAVFIGIMDKIEKDANKKGFRNTYSKEERFFIENFVRELKNEAGYING